MRCDPLVVDRRVVGFVCTSGRMRRCGCGERERSQCDYPLAGKRAGATCSRSLCPRCGTEWTTAAPVQPEPAYRQKWGRLDLCSVHATEVREGRGPDLLALCHELGKTAPGRALGQRLEAGRLAERIALLDDGAARALAFLGGPRGRDAGAERVGRLGVAMGELAASLRAAGRPDEVIAAALRCRASLALITAPRLQGTLPGLLDGPAPTPRAG